MASSEPLSNMSIQQALTASETELYGLIHDPDPRFLAALLNNPRLNDDHLLTLLRRHDLSDRLISRIYHARKQGLNHRLLLAIVKNPQTSGSLIRNLLPHLRLFELADLCKQPGVTPDQKLAAERTLLKRLPTTPLGHKIALARRGTPAIISELFKEGHPQVFEVCLASPHLRESAIFQFLKGARATADTISQIARHQRWKERPNLRLEILKHPRTPAVWLTLWLPKTNLRTLRQLRLSFKTQPGKRRLIDDELEKRIGRKNGR